MMKSDYIKIINKAVIQNEPKLVVQLLNEMFSTNQYKENIDIVFMSISSFQLYGFLAYLNENEQKQFFEFDLLRTAAYKGICLKYYNNEQKSLLLEFQQHNKIFLSAPTSFGKTSIISEYIIENNKDLNNIIFIVPTNSLMEELYQKFCSYNKNLNLNYNVSTQINIKSNKRNLLFLTPERFLILIETIDVNIFDLLVMDEAYKIVDFKNESISDFINNRAVRFRKVSEILGQAECRVIFLSPFTYNETESMTKFLKKYNIDKINRTLEYVDRDVISLDSSSDFKNYFNTNNTIAYNKSMTLPVKVSKILQQLKNEKNIVYIANYSKGYNIVDEIKGIEIDEKNKLYKRFNAFLNHLNNNYNIEGMPKWKVISSLEKGCGLYISPMPRFIKKEIINMYNNDLLNTLLVTTSFTEGVNTNAQNLIFTSLVNGPPANKLAEIDVLNIAGRAGRFSKSSFGKIFCIDNTVYNTVKKLQDSSLVMLKNYNYIKQSNHIDYEIDMMEDEYLSDVDKLKKKALYKDIERLGLTLKDLRISLNVSNKWKIVLYESFLNLKTDDLINLTEKITNLLSDESDDRVNSIEFILNYIRECLIKEGIEPYPMEKYETQAFDSTGICVWSRLYKIYCKGSSKEVIKSNMLYITNEFNKLIKDKTKQKKKKDVEDLFYENKKMWILKYYHEDLTINYNHFYSETFKFISNVIQYKIPFYLGFFVSIFNLFIRKNNINIEQEEFDVKKITLSYEEGTVSEEYNEMVDFGLSNDLILKLIKNKVNKTKLLNNEYNKENYDEYENIMINEFKEYYS